MIYILGIDALEYELVEKLNLNNLKQLEYDKIIVPINKIMGVPGSPEVWASFLIGEHFPKDFFSTNKYINALKEIFDFLNIDKNNRFSRKISSLFAKIGLAPCARLGNLNRETFLDIINSKKINVPFYNFDNKTFDLICLYDNNKISLEQTVDKIKLLYEYRKKHILNEVNNIGNEDVVFAFMHTMDMLQHLLFLHTSKIEQNYIDLDYYVSVLKRKLKNLFGDVIFVIVSDHGFDFDRGTHSNYAFYSSNYPLIPKPEKITDFYEIILGIVNKHDN